MTALTRKLLRDLWALRAQLVAIVAVVTSGVALFTSMVGAATSLERAQREYYARHRFADVFARVIRAPRSVAARARELPGVAEVEPRVVIDVGADVPGIAEPATLRLVSLPGRREGSDPLNGVHLRSGRLPERDDEIVANETFVDANRLALGSLLGANIHGRKKALRLVGVGLSPEHVFQLRGTELLPDDRRFGVVWMDEQALASAMDMAGAFNDLALRLVPGASEREVIAALDALLAPYGGLGAHGRDRVLSHRYLTEEFKQLDVSAKVIPIVFLGVAAFLLNVVLARLVATQRAQIGTLKAFGYDDLRVGAHYLELVVAVVLTGALARAALLRASAKAGTRAGVPLRAPAAGRVLRVMQDDGGVVAAGAPLVEIGDPRDLEIVLDLLSTDAVNVKPGAAVRVVRWGGDRALDAQVRAVEPAGFTKVSALGIEEQRVDVIADFRGQAEERGALGDGYRVEASVTVTDRPDALHVPLGALFRDGDAWAVYTVSDGKARLTHLDLGPRDRRRAEVLRGLDEGAKVVLHPSDRLGEGVRVKPTRDEANNHGLRVAGP
jgi:multidrug efflux pump subunit AcrA (membrane-fusion protein)